MSAPRPHPFALVFGDMAATRFPAVREALAGDLRVEHFLMTPAAVELLHELRPDQGLGPAVDDFVAFVHAAFCYWHDGERTTVLDEAETRALGPPAPEQGDGVPRFARDTARYIQIAPRVLWNQVEESGSHEPLDGWFALTEGEHLRVVACLGVHPERPGLSVLTAVGPAPAGLRRDDGSAPFAPQMDGGAEAGLHSVANSEELLWLAWASW